MGRPGMIRLTMFRRLLLSFLGIALVPLLIVSFVMEGSAERYLRDAAMRQLRAAASAKARLLTNFFDERERDLLTLTHHPLITGHLRYDHTVDSHAQEIAYLRAVMQSYGYPEITVLSTTGTVEITTSHSFVAGTSLRQLRAQVPELATAFEQAKTRLEVTHEDVVTGSGAVVGTYMAAPVISRKALLGIVVTRIDNTPLRTALDGRTATADTEELLLVTRRGDQTFFADGHPGSPGRAGVEASLGYQGEGAVADYRGTEVLAVWRYLPTLGWGIVVKINAAEALAPTAQMQMIMAALAAGAIAVVTFLAVVTSRAIARPIVNLRATARRIADGDFEHRVPVTNDDDTGQLAAAFNLMVERLALWAQVVRANERLETEIRERAALDAVKTQLEQAERLAGLGRVASTIAHEFNNVLMSIQAFNELQSRDVTPFAPRRATDEIGRAVTRGKTITDAVLRLTRASKPRMASVDVAAFFHTLSADLRALVPAGVDLSIRCNADGCFLRGDADHLQQVFTNLVLNACDAMPNGGRVVVVARVDGDHLHVRVQDDGAGMKPDVVAKAFEPLFTTKPKGTGLGLPITHEIIRSHGGTIRVESALGIGTTFDIVLDLAEPPRPAIAPEEPLPSDRAYRLLLVEDDEAVAEGLSSLLRLLGMEVDRVATGSAALQAFEWWTGDAVVLDIGLPDMDGVAVYHRIVERNPGIGVVFATGHADEAKVSEVLQRRNVSFLRKPFETHTLIAALDAVIDAGTPDSDSSGDSGSSVGASPLLFRAAGHR
jgi:signal transduction histidine kinase/ActR/RegA family two-component response regulator